MINKNNKRIKLLIFLLSIAIFIGIVVRLYLLPNHITHIDDIGVAITIRTHQNEMIDKIDVCRIYGTSNFICKYEYSLHEKRAIGAPSSRLGEQLDKLGLLSPLRQIFFLYKQYNLIPLSWTYAPAQFYLTQAIVKNEQSYYQAKVFGRLPSLIFSLLCFPLIFWISKTYHQRDYFLIPAIIAISLYALSWQNIIYAAQMESYAIGPFAVFILIYILIKQSILRAWLLSPFIMGLVIALLAMCQYQILLFIPGFLIVLFFITERKKVTDWLWLTGGFLILSLPFVWFPIPPFGNNPGVNWNAGPGGEFVITHGASAAVKLLEILKLSSWLPIVMESMLSPLAEESLFIKSLFIFFITLGLLGTFYRKDPSSRAMIFFTFITALIWAILLYMSKLTFGPTRHSMVLIPFFIFFIAEGFVTFTYFLSAGNRSLLASIFIVIWITFFLTSFDLQITQRIDQFDDKNIAIKIEEYEASLIIRNFSNGSTFIPGMVESYSVNEKNIWPFSFDNKNLQFKPNPPRVIGLMARAQLTDDQIKLIYEGATGKFNAPVNKLQLLYKEERQVNVEIDWSSRTNNGGNGFFFYIFRTN